MSDEEDDSSPIWSRLSNWGLAVGTVAVFVGWAGIGLDELGFGLAAAVAVVVVRHRLGRPVSFGLDIGGLARFVPYFTALSIRGGIDVAGRAFRPSMPLAPGTVDIALRVDPEGTAAAVYGATISMVPGTLCVEIGDSDRALVHLVDRRAGFEEELVRLEGRVAEMCGASVGQTVSEEES